MNKTPAWRRYLTFWRAPIADDVEDELRFHTNMRVKEHMARGMSEDEARRAVSERLGDIDAARAECVELGRVRELNTGRAAFFDALRHDLRYACRGLFKRPALAVSVIVTLALGFGANAAIFSVVDRLLFRAAPMLRDVGRTNRIYVSYPDYDLKNHFVVDAMPYVWYSDITASNRSFERTAMYAVERRSIGAPEDRRDLPVAGVTPSFFTFFDAPPALGRYFNERENATPSGDPVVVLSYAMWQLELGGRPDALGAKIRIGPTTYTVLGVAPRSFVGLWPDAPPVAFMPYSAYAAVFNFHQGGQTWWNTLDWGPGGMLVTRRASTSVERAAAEITRDMRARWPNPTLQPTAIVASTLYERGPQQSSASRVAALIGAMALVVLLIAGANVANLLLARAIRRRREVAVRLALGISRRRLMLQLLIETLLLASLGGLAGLMAARWGGPMLRAAFLRPSADTSVVTDTRTLMFTALGVVVAGVLTGLAPISQAMRMDITRFLKTGARDGALQRSRARAALLVLQGALSVLLLVAAGLFVRSLYGVRNMRLGFDVDPVLVVDVNMHGVPFDRAQSLALWDRLLATAKLVPGVERATLTGGTPMAGVPNAEIIRPADMDEHVFQTLPFIYESNVSPQYFATLGTRILRGRGFDSTDDAGAERVAVVSTGLARTLWPGREPIGQCIRIRARVLGAHALEERPCSYVVGVAEDVKNRSVRADPDLFFYLPYAQEVAWRPRLAIRTHGDAVRYADAVRAVLQRNMPASSFVTVTPYSSIFGDETRSWRMGATMFAAFGALAMILAAVGLYSAISYDVAQRTHEIGIRRALGAQAGDVVRLVVRQGLVLGGGGAIAGAAIALAAANRIAPLLFEESPRDPFVYVIVVTTMLGVALVASVVPARRAARVDPNLALRAE